jgi:hypothetical protein
MSSSPSSGRITGRGRTTATDRNLAQALIELDRGARLRIFLA